MLKQDLVVALEKGDRDGALLALERGASPDGWSGATPHYCLYCRVVVDSDLEMAMLVFPKGNSGIRIVPRHNPPLLNVAVAMSHTDMAALLLESDKDVNLRARYGYHKHIASGSPGDALVATAKLRPARSEAGILVGDGTSLEIVPIVVAEGDFDTSTSPEADDDFRSYTRGNMWMNTLLHDAVVLKNPAMLRLLLAHGVRPDLENERGETARALALRLGYDELAGLLEKAGG